MNLRNVTIWTTGLMSLSAIIFPLSAIPLTVSWLIARRLKDTVPLILLLIPVVLTGFMYANLIYDIHFHPDRLSCGVSTTAFSMALSSLIIMSPFWFAIGFYSIMKRLESCPRNH